jgi:hypothetical protein
MVVSTESVERSIRKAVHVARARLNTFLGAKKSTST